MFYGSRVISLASQKVETFIFELKRFRNLLLAANNLEDDKDPSGFILNENSLCYIYLVDFCIQHTQLFKADRLNFNNLYIFV